MALTNPKIFGLNVKSELTDVKNKNTATDKEELSNEV